MKAALMNQNALPFVAPPGPLASAPVASAANQNMFYMSTDFGLCKYVSVFNNEGSDWIDCGRPSWLAGISLVDHFIDVVFNPATTNAGYLFSDNDGTNVSTQMLSAGTISYFVKGGGNSAAFPTNTPVWKIATGSRVGGVGRIAVNGVYGTDGIVGAMTSVAKLYIGGRTDGATANYEGPIALFRARNGSGSVIDTLDMNKWDGSSTMRFDSGHACTVTDGAPFTTKSYACIPWSVLKCP